MAKVTMGICCALMAATAGAATPEGHYGGSFTAEGVTNGRITFQLQKTSAVGVLACTIGKKDVSIPLQGVIDAGKLTLTAPARTPGVKALHLAGEAKDGMFKGTVEGTIRGVKVKGDFTAALASN